MGLGGAASFHCHDKRNVMNMNKAGELWEDKINYIPSTNNCFTGNHNELNGSYSANANIHNKHI